MKRLIFSALFVLSVFATNVFAEGEVNVSGGYTRLDVGESPDLLFNDVVNSLKKEVTNGEVKAEADQHGSLNGAFTVGLDYFFDNSKNVKSGFRVAHLWSGKKTGIRISGNDGHAGACSYDASISLTSAMPGVKLNFDISEKFSLNGKLFAGIAYVKINNHYTSLDGVVPINNAPHEEDVSEYKFAMDTSVGAQYLLTKKFGLGLDLGYRPFPARLSGFTATLGLNFKI